MVLCQGSRGLVVVVAEGSFLPAVGLPTTSSTTSLHWGEIRGACSLLSAKRAPLRAILFGSVLVGDS